MIRKMKFNIQSQVFQVVFFSSFWEKEIEKNWSFKIIEVNF